MLTIALETSTDLGSVAVGYGDRLVSESTLAVRAKHSETVLPEVARLLEGAGVEPGQVERVVVGAGPGSFTGVRIAAALAKGWCHARRVPLYAYSSLRSLAASSGMLRVCALFDARRGEVYAEAYDGDPLAVPIFGPVVGPLDEILGRLLPVATWSFVGEGAERNRGAIESAGGRVLAPHLGVPRAAALLWLAHHDPTGEVKDVSMWEPCYVRASGAERQALRGG